MPLRDFPIRDLPPLRENAQAWLEGRPPAPSTPRPAATVMIVRDGADGVEVFMLRRVATMAFGPSAMVFPGGGVDSRDGHELPWAGPPVVAWATRLAADVDSTRMLVVAAIREVFEECGVLFASAGESGPLVDVASERWREIRQGLVDRELSLGAVLRSEHLVLRTDLLRAQAHWVTPEIEPRQFDARIFAAVMPEGQQADGLTSEADHAGWFRAADVLADRAAGRAILLPPTLVCLEDLARATSAADFFSWEPVIRRLRPALVRDDAGEPVLRLQL